MEGLELIKETPEEVVVKIRDDSDWDFVTITRGPSPKALFTYKDQSSRMVYIGANDPGDPIFRAANEIADFVQEKCHILLEYTGRPIDYVSVVYDDTTACGRLSLIGYCPFWAAHYTNKDAKHAEDMKICASRFIYIKEWRYTSDNEWKGIRYKT